MKKLSIFSMVIIGIIILLLLTVISIIVIIKVPQHKETIRTIFELVSYISAPILILITVFGLQQITVTRDIFRKQSLRESFKIATDECRKFSEEVSPLIYELEKFVKENKITIFKDSVVTETEKGFKVDGRKVKKQQIIKMNEVKDKIASYLNGMELFALPFVTRIADDNIGFLTMGESFVEEVDERVKILMPLCGLSMNDHKAIWSLYYLWKPRLEKAKLMKEKSDLDQKINKIEYKKPKKAIGTE